MNYPFEELCDARESGALVRAHVVGVAESGAGRVVAVSDKLVLMEIVDSGVRFDGYAALPIDITWRVEDPCEWHAFIQSALDVRNLKPTPIDIPVDSWCKLIEATRRTHPIVRLWAPNVFGSESVYGYVLEVDDLHLRFRPIDSNGVWGEYDQIMSLSELARLDFAGDLETMLSALTIDLGI